MWDKLQLEAGTNNDASISKRQTQAINLKDATNANLPSWVDGFGVSVSSSLQLSGCNSRPLWIVIGSRTLVWASSYIMILL